MALKLSLSNFRTSMVERLFHKGLRVEKFIPNQFHSSFHVHSSNIKNFNFFTLNQFRTICVSSPVLRAKIVPFNLSDIGEGIVEVTMKEWFVKPGDKIAQFDNICEVQSDKASVTITSRYDGIVKKLHCEIDDMTKVGAALIDIEIEEEGDSSDSDSDDEVTDSKLRNECNASSISDNVKQGFEPRAFATPAVRRIAKENNINIQEIKGTGRDGRVLKEDILAYIEEKKAGTTSGRPSVPLPQQLSQTPIARSHKPDDQFVGKDRTKQVDGFKKAMVKTMTQSWTIPHFSYCDEIVLTELVKINNEIKKISQANNVKVTFMPFFIKAASLALLKYPELNSHIDENCENWTIKAAHNIGVAMDTHNGLIVPNIKNVQNLNIIEIAKELNRLQVLGDRSQLGINDLKDGTFTLSNVGSIGGTYTKPIIFSPQVIIGALGKIQVLPRFDENKNVVEAHILNVSWSADHRIVDGATVGRFSNLWKAYLSSPKLLLKL